MSAVTHLRTALYRAKPHHLGKVADHGFGRLAVAAEALVICFDELHKAIGADGAVCGGADAMDKAPAAMLAVIRLIVTVDADDICHGVEPFDTGTIADERTEATRAIDVHKLTRSMRYVNRKNVRLIVLFDGI